MKREVLAANLRKLTSDTRTSLEGLMGPSHDPSLPPGVMKPFDTIYEIVFQLTMRTVGAHEISTNPALLKKMLGLFETIERAGSATKIIFPWAPSLGHLRRIMAGAQVYMMLGNIVKSRREKGVRYEDAMQVLVDSSSSVMDITTFVVGSLYAGQLNSGINAAWLLIELAQHREWYAQVQAEVDAAVKKHRTSEKQSAVDVLDTLDMDAWESEFPLIDLCLRECIRFQLTGSAFRKNISGQDIPIGNGEIVPRDAYAVYYIDDVHFNPSIYSDPYKWDPSRYLPDRAEDKKSPMAYAGWGLGRHPCRKFSRICGNGMIS